LVRLARSSFKPKKQQARFASAVPTTAVVARYTKNGRPSEVLSLKTEPLKAATGDQVTVKMLFAPINPADFNIIQGNYPTQPDLPAIGGSEGVGQVVAVGDKAKSLKVGDLVIPRRQGFGTWRTHATSSETELLAIPAVEGVQHEYLASLSVNPATAYRMLNDFVSLKEGDVVIQNGANSMVGLSVVQLAASMGVKTINIIRKRSDYDELVERMKGYGAFIVCSDDYIRTAEFRKMISDLPKPKLALNCVGGPTATEMSRLLGVGGTMVTYGGMSLQPVTVPTSPFIFNDITLKGFWMSRWYEQHSDKEKLALFSHLQEMVKNQKLRLWTERHSFQDGFSNALERATNTSSRGRKVLLKFE